MHDLTAELETLPDADATRGALQSARQREAREVFSVRAELTVLLYVAVLVLVGGAGLLVRANLDRIGPLALLTGIVVAAALCYAIALRARVAGRERSLGEDYVLLLGALLASTAVGYAEVQFQLFGSGWSRHLLLLALWHLATAYFLSSRLVLAVALTTFAGWLGVEARLGPPWDALHPLLGAGPRLLLCAALFHLGGRLHRRDPAGGRAVFREVYRQFAAHFGFFGALALGAAADTRWFGALLLLMLAILVGRAGLAERRQSFLLYAVGYSTIGLLWLETLLLRDGMLISWVGLVTVIGAAVLLLNLRARLRESGT